MQKSKRLPSLLSAFCAAAILLGATACGGSDKGAVGTDDKTGTTASEEAATTETVEAVKEDEAVNNINSISDQYQWGNVQIVGGGYTSGIIYNPTEEGLVYARTDIGGAYRMDKESGEWIPMVDEFGTDDYTYYGIDGLATDPVETNRVYCLAGMYRDWKAAVLCSEDYGETWKISPLEFSCGGNEPNRFADRLVIDPSDNKTLYVGSRSDGLWVSHDYGASFTKIESFPTLGKDYTEDGYSFGITAIAFDTANPQRIYVGTGDKTNYISDDRGVTWKELEGLPKGLMTYHIDVSGDNVYFTMGGKAGPYQVNQGGLRCCNSKTGEVTDLTPEEAAGHGFGDLAIDPKNSDIMYLSSIGKWGGKENDTIFRTTDGGKTWQSLFTGDGEDRLFRTDYSEAPWLDWGGETAKLGWMMGCIAINPFNNDEIMYGTGATIFRSTNLTKWGEEEIVFEVHCKGLEETAVLGLDAPNSDSVSLYSALGDIDGFAHHDVNKAESKLSDNGHFSSTSSISSAWNNPDVVARAGSDNRCVGISTDGGETWTYSRPEGATGNSGTVKVNCDGTIVYWSNSNSAGIYRTLDLGKTWEKLEKAFAKPIMETDKFNPDVLYAVGGGMLYYSTDKGTTMELAKIAAMPEPSSLVASPYKEGELYIGAKIGGVYKLNNYGNNDAELVRLGMTSAYSIAIGAAENDSSPFAIYAIGYSEKTFGVWRSVDDGATWYRINDDQHQFGSIGTTLAADNCVFGRVYFGTNGRGIIMGTLK